MVLLLSIYWCASAQTRIIEELFRSEIVQPQEKGEVQVTLSPEVPRSGRDWFRMPLDVEYGITDQWQVGVGWSGISRRRAGTSDGDADAGEVELSVKRSFMNLRDTRTHVAVGFEGGASEYRPFAVIARDLRRAHAQVFALGSLNVKPAGPGEVGTDEIEDSKVEWGVGGFFKAGRTVFTNELNWKSAEWNQFAPGFHAYWTPGAVWRLRTESVWEIGVAGSIGLTRASDRASLVVKVTHEFDRLW